MSTPTDESDGADHPVASDTLDPGTAEEGLDRDPQTIPNAPNRDRSDEPDADEMINQTDAAE
jgi:hypothetical protein